MAGFQIQGTGGVVSSIAGAVRKFFDVTLPQHEVDPDAIGTAIMGSLNDGGSIGSNLADIKSPETTEDYRLRTSQDNLLDWDVFQYTAQNSSKHYVRNTTLTLTYTGNAIVTNGGNVTTTTTGVNFQTYRWYPTLGPGDLYVDFTMQFTALAGANTVIDWGLFQSASSTPYAPSDGVYFRHDSAGVKGVTNFNGTEIETVLSFTPTANKVYRYLIVCTPVNVKFWINDVLYLTVPRGTGLSQPWSQQALPVGIRHAHTGAAGVAVQAKFGSYAVSSGGPANNRLWPSVMAGMGMSAIQGASGHTQGQTAVYANSAAPTNITLSNTTPAGNSLSMGGQISYAAVAGAETDYAIIAYTNPAPTLAIPGRNLVIRGIRIDTANLGAAVATTPHLFQWALGVGATAISLATAEAAATRAPRRLALGFQSLAVAAAIGASAVPIDINLDAPVVVEPGTILHLILKMPVATATASQVIRHTILFNAYWE